MAERSPQEIGTQESDMHSEDVGNQHIAPILAAFASYFVYNYYRYGLQSIEPVFTSKTPGIKDSIAAALQESVTSAVEKSGAAYLTSTGGTVGGRTEVLRNVVLQETLESIRAIPDHHGRTYAQRVDTHLLNMRKEITSRLQKVEMAKDGILRQLPFINRMVTRKSFVSYMKTLERYGRDMTLDDPLSRRKFLRATKDIRKWAIENPGKTIPTSMVAALNTQTMAAYRGSTALTVYNQVHRRWLGNLVRLVRNISNSAFQYASLAFFGSNDKINAVRWVLSSAHRLFDMCDGFSSEDNGLGEGVWLIGYAPFPAHAN